MDDNTQEPKLRVTQQDVDDEILAEYYYTAADGVRQATGEHVRDPDDPLHRQTHCTLVLRSGFTVTASSACVHADTFNAGIGQGIARERAEAQVCKLLGYRLANELAGFERQLGDVDVEPADANE